MLLIDCTTAATAKIPRPLETREPIDAVREIISSVRNGGDAALLKLTERLDGVALKSLRVTDKQIREARRSLPKPDEAALLESARRITVFAEGQSIKPWSETIGGGVIGEAVFAVSRAGLYVPGGRASYPSTVLMTAIPARVAGVEEIVMCVPPSADGSVVEATLAAASIAEVDQIYTVGGAQAIAAMAFGTETIPRVDVIAGPGNIYVALAKRELAGTVAIDSVAGPSEIVIVADGEADPWLIAWDLVAQAEHGPGGAFAVVTWDANLLDSVQTALDKILVETNAGADLTASLEAGAVGVLVGNAEQAAEAVNAFAPEHLELQFEGAEERVNDYRTAGAIFVGPYSPVSLGDYLAGTNHVLPTGGTARFWSGLRTSHFQRTTSIVKHTRDSLKEAAGLIGALAAVEGLPNHARAVNARFVENR